MLKLNQTARKPVNSGRVSPFEKAEPVRQAEFVGQTLPASMNATFRAFSSHKEDVKHELSNKIKYNLV